MNPGPKRGSVESMLRSGKNPKEIRAALNVTPQYISNVRSQLGLPPFQRGVIQESERNLIIRKLVANGASLASVGRMYDIGASRVFDIVHAEQVRARARANNHIPDFTHCQICGRAGSLEKHHPDYSRPLDVIHVCPPCHKVADRERRRHETETKQAA